MAVSTRLEYIHHMQQQRFGTVLIHFESITREDCLSLCEINEKFKGLLAYFGISSDKAMESDAQIRSLIGPDLTFERVFPKEYSKAKIDHIMGLCQVRHAIRNPTFLEQADTDTDTDTNANELSVLSRRLPRFKETLLFIICLVVTAIVIISLSSNTIDAPPAPMVDLASEPPLDNRKKWEPLVAPPSAELEELAVIDEPSRIPPAEVVPAIPPAEVVPAIPPVEVVPAIPPAAEVPTIPNNKPPRKARPKKSVKKTPNKTTANGKSQPKLPPVAILTPADKNKLLQYNSLAITKIQQKIYSPVSTKSALYFFNGMYKISGSSKALRSLANNITSNILSDARDAIKNQDIQALEVAIENLRNVARYILKIDFNIHNQSSYQKLLSRHHSRITRLESTLANNIEPGLLIEFKRALEELKQLLKGLCPNCKA
jgi:hypothetical protein